MPLQRQNIALNFGMGLDTKTDPNQIQIGKFAALSNSVFTTTNQLKKREGFPSLPSLPDSTSSYVTTFNGALTAIGTSLYALNPASASWITRGSLQPVQLSVTPLIRNSLNQTQCDSALSSLGSICTVFTQSDPGGTHYYYSISDSVTGQSIIGATQILTPTESPRVFALGNYFIILFSQSANLKYISIPVANPSSPIAAATLVTNYAPGTSPLAFDGAVFNNSLFISYNATDGGGAIRSTGLTSFLVRLSGATGVSIAAAKSADIVSVTIDRSVGEVWTMIYKTSGTTGYVMATDTGFNSVLAATQIISSGTILNITGAATNNVLTVFYEVSNNYGYDAAIASHFINTNTITIGGSVGSATTLQRSTGLASKAFILGGTTYFLSVYASPYQPTYFLSDSNGNLLSKLAYQNGGGYLTLGLPRVSVSGTTASIPYLFKDLITAVNKNTNVPSGTQVNGIYSQTGVNFANFSISTQNLSSAEIGSNLNLTGGFLWSYDGGEATENNFFLYPDSIEATWSATGGSIHAQPDGATNTNAYFYQVTYEWTDLQGNAFRSAPSIPIAVTTTSNGTSGSITVNVPNLRLTYKTNVKIVIYRWSVAQQAYYQVTSISAPTISSKTADATAFVDTLADATILGNSLLYTTGGVVEDIGPPAFSAVTLYNTRLFGIESEDPNTLWYSKQVISGTPVEMSDLFTIYTPPTTGAQASTGPNACLFPMDDKLILFKKNAGIYYLTGIGPDNTGANNDFSNATFITSTVGCNNQNSIVFIPQGLLFQDGTGKGLWLLGRDLSTQYIGAGVEAFNSQKVTSAFAIPGTNQVRFTLGSGTMLVYDYFQQQWNTFQNLKAISSCLYQNAHTFIDSFGNAFQEVSNTFQDGSIPVLMSLQTGWINMAGLQGYQRAYELYLLGNYLSPHTLTVSIAYDYNPSPTQTTTIQPDNFSGVWGGGSSWGDQPTWGGHSNVEQWRIFFEQQQCEAFQITIQENYDPSFGVPPGAGLTLSGMNLIVGVKKNAPRLKAAVQVG